MTPSLRTALDAIAAILAAPQAWSLESDLRAAGHDPATLAALEADGLLARWDLPADHGKGPPPLAWTLTPWGAWSLGVRIVERGETVLEPRRAKGKLRIVRRRLHPPDTPRWAEGRYDARHPEQVRLPRTAHTSALVLPELVADPLPGPEYLMDEVSGEPIRLFGDRAVRVRIDRRLRGVGGRRPKRRRVAVAV